MKKVIFILVLSSFFVPLISLASNTYTFEQACQLSNGIHTGHISGLDETRPIDEDYSMSSFYRVRNHVQFKDSIHFVHTDRGGLWQQEFSKLDTISCTWEYNTVYATYLHEKRPNTIYSPEIAKANRLMMILEDWETIDGKVYHVSIIIDSKKHKVHYIQDQILLKNKAIKTFVWSNQFYWEVKSYNNWIARIEVRLNENKKRTFAVRFR